MQEARSFERDIRPLFREEDVDMMFSLLDDDPSATLVKAVSSGL